MLIATRRIRVKLVVNTAPERPGERVVETDTYLVLLTHPWVTGGPGEPVGDRRG